MKLKKEKAPKEKPTSKPKEPKVQKPKPEGYVMKKNAGMKILRIVLWTMLIFVFFKGVVSIFQRDKSEVVDQMIRDFKASYSQFTNQNEEVMSFAQNFAREYLTYTARGEEDYKSRLKDYVAANFFSDTVSDFSASAEAIYVRAYRMEDYSDNQVDVYVQAEVEYTRRILQDGTTYTEEVTRQPVTLKVPVYYSNGRYVVESLPLMVSDSVYLKKYSPERYYGTSLGDAEATAVKTSVTNFLKAYCEQDESVINYYLDSSADKDAFTGLDGRFTFSDISDISCYQGENGIICLVSFHITDTGNNTQLLQKMNLTLRESGGKYYIKTADTRTGNLKIN